MRCAAQNREVGDCPGMIGGAAQGLSHRGLRVADRALTIAGEAEIDPGVRPRRLEADGGGEGLRGASLLADREPRLAIGVMGLWPVGRRVAGVAGGAQGGAEVSGRALGGEAPQRRHNRGVARRWDRPALLWVRRAMPCVRRPPCR